MTAKFPYHLTKIRLRNLRTISARYRPENLRRFQHFSIAHLSRIWREKISTKWRLRRNISSVFLPPPAFEAEYAEGLQHIAQ
jgi:hypothetical protein